MKEAFENEPVQEYKVDRECNDLHISNPLSIVMKLSVIFSCCCLYWHFITVNEFLWCTVNVGQISINGRLKPIHHDNHTYQTELNTNHSINTHCSIPLLSRSYNPLMDLFQMKSSIEPNYYGFLIILCDTVIINTATDLAWFIIYYSSCIACLD